MAITKEGEELLKEAKTYRLVSRALSSGKGIPKSNMTARAITGKPIRATKPQITEFEMAGEDITKGLQKRLIRTGYT